MEGWDIERGWAATAQDTNRGLRPTQRPTEPRKRREEAPTSPHHPNFNRLQSEKMEGKSGRIMVGKDWDLSDPEERR